MPHGLTTSWQIVTKSRNDAVSGALVPLLASKDPEVLGSCVRALARRRDPAGHQALVARFDSFDEVTKAALAEFPGRMTDTLCEAILGANQQSFHNALDAVRRLEEYEVIPTLAKVVETDLSKTERAAQTIVYLAKLLSDELAGKRRPKDHRDPQRMWGPALSSLQETLGRMGVEGRREIAQAFLLLTPRNSKTLAQILSEPKHSCHSVLMEALQTSSEAELLGQLLAVSIRSAAPQAARDVLGRRCDAPFIRCLLREVAAFRDEGTHAAKGLKRIKRIDWMRNDRRVLDALTGAEQEVAVLLAVSSGIEQRTTALEFLLFMVQHGKPEGRRAACAELASFKGDRVDSIILRVLGDESPEVQAAAVGQLRQRGIPDALTRVAEALASPHKIVQESARASLADFTVERFRAQFDEMDEQSRSATGELVRRMDRSLPEALRDDLVTPSRARRLRAIRMAIASATVDQVEREIIDSLMDEDHFIRAAAAEALSQTHSYASRSALREALDDRSVAVQQAAQESLEFVLTDAGANAVGSYSAAEAPVGKGSG